MIARDDFDRLMTVWFDETAGSGTPDYLDETLEGLTRIGQRPAWMSPRRWLPMQLTMPRVAMPRAIPILALIALLVIALIAAALYVGSRQPPLPPPFGLARTGSLIYDANGEIFVRDLDGGSRAVMTEPDSATSPIWARDGTRFAYWSGSPGDRGELRVADADGRSVAAVATDVTLPLAYAPQSPTWSPDGARIAFSSDDGILEIVNADGTGRHTVGVTPPLRFDPAWSPDGTLIAFRRQTSPGDDASRQVYVMRPDGTGERQVSAVSDATNSAMAPSWSADGRLLYDAKPGPFMNGDFGDIIVASYAGDRWSERIVVGGDTPDWLPRWSNDGTRIVFLRSFIDGEGDLYVVGADGSALRKLSDRPMSTAGACWTPDDTAIAGLTGEMGKPINGQAGATYVLFDANTGNVLDEIPAPGIQGIVDCSWQRLAT
jgi:Tol biopolymer transport system component